MRLELSKADERSKVRSKRESRARLYRAAGHEKTFLHYSKCAKEGSRGF